MSAFVKVNQIAQTVESLSADPGEEFPFLHTITVVDRVVSVDKPELVQNNIKTETVTLNLDSEWDGLSCIINIGNSETPTSLIWSGQPVIIPSELMADTGTLNVSVVGYGDDGALRAVTKKADAMFTVVASGYVEGDEPVPDPTTILGQLIQAADNANQAADRFNQASEDIGDISDAAAEVKGYANSAKTSETNAASSATAASQSETNAAASVSAAKVSETNAAGSATAAQQAVDGFGLQVGTTTTGEPGSDAAVEIQKTGTKYTANFTIPRGDKGDQASVAHDGTLTGDGTASKPLGAAMGSAVNQTYAFADGAFDLNNLTDFGIFALNNDQHTIANLPVNPFRGCVFVTNNGYPSSNKSSICQVALCRSWSGDAEMYTRALVSGTWHEWKRMAFASDIPDASALTSRITTLQAGLDELAAMQTRLQALEARVKSLETH